jgi:hypothetical protein
MTLRLLWLLPNLRAEQLSSASFPCSIARPPAQATLLLDSPSPTHGHRLVELVGVG